MKLTVIILAAVALVLLALNIAQLLDRKRLRAKNHIIRSDRDRIEQSLSAVRADRDQIVAARDAHCEGKNRDGSRCKSQIGLGPDGLCSRHRALAAKMLAVETSTPLMD